MAEAKVGVIIEAEDRASAVLSGVNSKLGGLQKQAETMKPAFETMALVGAAAFATIAYAVTKSVQAAMEAQRVQTQLGAVLKSTGMAAGVTSGEAVALASSLQNVTAYSDEAILSAENLLLTFTNIKDDVFPEATQTVLISRTV